MSPESEALFDTANTLDDIRNKVQESNKLESELKESISNVQKILNDRTERLSLKEKKFKCNNSANEEAITELFEVKVIIYLYFYLLLILILIQLLLFFKQSIHDIDPTLIIEETTQAQIRHHSTLIEFIDTHCRTRAYSFQVILQSCTIINYKLVL